MDQCVRASLSRRCALLAFLLGLLAELPGTVGAIFDEGV
jgi:hypothetical protein